MTITCDPVHPVEVQPSCLLDRSPWLCKRAADLQNFVRTRTNNKRRQCRGEQVFCAVNNNSNGSPSSSPPFTQANRIRKDNRGGAHRGLCVATCVSAAPSRCAHSFLPLFFVLTPLFYICLRVLSLSIFFSVVVGGGVCVKLYIPLS